jgi:integrase
MEDPHMPRLGNRLPVPRLHKPSGQARVRLEGREYWLGRFGSPEAARGYAELLSRLAAGGSAEAPALPALHLLTIAELIERFWAHSKIYYRKDGQPTGEHITIRAALRPVLNLFGREPAAEFTPSKLKLVREEMIRRGLSRRYINECVGRIKRLFNWSVENELVPAAVADAIARVKGLQRGRSLAREKPPVGPVSDEAVEATLPELPAVVADLVRIQRLTGHRPGELLGMTVEDLDRGDPEVWVHRPQRHKTQHHAKQRTVFIGPKAQAILAPHVVRAGSGRIFRYNRDGYRRAITRACDRLGRPRWSPNQLRHAAATAIRDQFSLDHAQASLGHSCASMTEHYAKVAGEKARAVASAVG